VIKCITLRSCQAQLAPWVARSIKKTKTSQLRIQSGGFSMNSLLRSIWWTPKWIRHSRSTIMLPSLRKMEVAFPIIIIITTIIRHICHCKADQDREEQHPLNHHFEQEDSTLLRKWIKSHKCILWHQTEVKNIVWMN